MKYPNTKRLRNAELREYVKMNNQRPIDIRLSYTEIGKLFADKDNPNGISKARVSQIVRSVQDGD